jgi:hypothetical protein
MSAGVNHPADGDDQRSMAFTLRNFIPPAMMLATFIVCPQASAIECNPTQSFSSWLQGMKRDAVAAGVS